MCQDGVPLPFRYNVRHRAMVNVFEPKALASDADLTDIRASMFGAAFLELGLSKLPSSRCQEPRLVVCFDFGSGL